MKRAASIPLGDGPEREAARMMNLSAEEFRAVLPRLFRRGFPLPDETTGRYDLDAVNAWRRNRHPRLFNSPLASGGGAEDAFATRPRIEAVS